jgi:hypothetical protein
MKTKTKTKTKKRSTRKAKFSPVTSSESVMVTAFFMSAAVFSERMVEPATKLFDQLSAAEKVAVMAIGDKIMEALRE